MTRIDRRVLDPGLTVTTETLARVFADHHRGVPAAATCPACGHHNPTDTDGDCPTVALVRPLLGRRLHEDTTVSDLLTADQFDDLLKARKPVSVRRRARTVPVTVELFDVTPYRTTRGPQ